MRNFELIGGIDVQPILDALVLWDGFFKVNQVRQTTKGSPHRDTETIFLRMPQAINTMTIFHSMEVVDYVPMRVPAFAHAITRIGELAYGKIARAMVVKLFPGGHVTAHRDEGAYAEATDRVHCVVTSNDGCEFRCGSESIFPKPEETWWFDKSIEHEVFNRGDADRIHLICDLWKD